MQKLLFVAAVLIVSGCATTSEETNTVHTERTYRTGSNLPVRDRNSPDVKTVDPSAFQDPVRSGAMPRPTSPAGGR